MPQETVDSPDEGGLARAKLFLWDSGNSIWRRGPGDAQGLQVQGPVAHDGVDAGNPVKIGAVYSETLPAVAAGDVVNVFADKDGRLQTALEGVLSLSQDAALNDNDKQATVTTGKEWKLLGFAALWAATATAGNRNVFFSIGTAGQNEFVIRMQAAVVASQTVYFVFVPGGTEGGAVGDLDTIFLGLYKDHWLPAGIIIRLRDLANIDSNDDIEFHLRYLERDAV